MSTYLNLTLKFCQKKSIGLGKKSVSKRPNQDQSKDIEL